MRLVRSALAALTATVALSALAVTPAAASPEDGKGCAGIKEIPAAYVCVISATPQNALPSTTTASIPVTTPTICYVADCLAATTVNVPVPGAVPGSGAIAVLWYGGVYYPIAVGSVPGVPGVPGGLVPLQAVVDLANSTVAYALAWVAYADYVADNPGLVAEDVVDSALGYGTWDSFVKFLSICYRYPTNCVQ